MIEAQLAPYLPFIILSGIAVGAASIGGWIHTTRLRIKNGYPLTGGWGQAIYPKVSGEQVERIALLTQENAQLRAELGSVKDRLSNVERIVTDSSHRLTADIDALRGTAN